MSSKYNAVVDHTGKAYIGINLEKSSSTNPNIKEGFWTNTKNEKITEARIGDIVRFHVLSEGIEDGEALDLILKDWDGWINIDDTLSGASTSMMIKYNKGHVEFTIPKSWEEDMNDDIGDEIELYYKIDYKEDSFELPSDSDNYLKVYPKTKGILVFYHGGPFGSGQIREKAEKEASGHTAVIYNIIANYIKSKGIEVKGAIIAPAVTQDLGVLTGRIFINENYVHGDQIIIYGYSYGGDNAVNLSESISYKIDTMIIVDSSDGPMRQMTVDRSIPDNVEYALNIYQRKASGGFCRTGKNSDDPDFSEENTSDGSSNTMGSRGFPHSAEGDNTVENYRSTNRKTTHGNIQQIEEELILKTIKSRIDAYKHK